MTRSETKKAITGALSTPQGRLIGAVTFWSLTGMRIRRDNLRSALDGLGFGFAVPKDPKAQKILRMAIEIVSRESPTSVVFDRVSDSKSEVVFAMSDRSSSSVAEVATYQHRTRLRLDKATGFVTLEDWNDPVLVAVVAKYRELLDYPTTSEIGLTLINVLRGRGTSLGLCAVNLRGESGGVYFVPEANVDRLNDLANLVDTIGGDGAITVWPIPVGDRAIAQAVTAATLDFGDRIRVVRADVADLMGSLSSTDELDPDGRRVLARAKAFASISARAEVFGDLLGDLRADLEKDLAALRKVVEDRVGSALGTEFDLDESEGDFD
jgi:hypothetical protein